MLAEERFNEIVRMVNEKGTVTVQELTEILETSESTVRRALVTLHKQGRVIKVHGGATAVGMERYTRDESVDVRQDLNIEEKTKVGKYAAEMIGKADFVYIDAGTTTDYLIEHVTEKDAVYVTNGILHARKLVQKGCRVFLLAGQLKDSTLALVGEEAMNSLKKYHFTKGFFGANGIQVENGCTTPDISEAAVKEAAVGRCREAYVLADSSKFNQVSSVRFAEFKDVKIITTELEDPSFRKYTNIVEVEKK